ALEDSALSSSGSSVDASDREPLAVSGDPGISEEGFDADGLDAAGRRAPDGAGCATIGAFLLCTYQMPAAKPAPASARTTTSSTRSGRLTGRAGATGAAAAASTGTELGCSKPQRHELTLFGTRRPHFGQFQLSTADGVSTHQLSARRTLRYRRKRGT